MSWIGITVIFGILVVFCAQMSTYRQGYKSGYDAGYKEAQLIFSRKPKAGVIYLYWQ